MKKQIIEKSKPVRRKLVKLNQLILTLPVWTVLGFSKTFKKDKEDSGWQKSSKNENYNKMY